MPTIERIWKMTNIVLCLLIVASMLSCSDDSDDPVSPSGDGNTITIGALFGFAEDGPVHGQSMLAALQVAEEDINEYLKAEGSGQKVEFVSYDTEGDSWQALSLYMDITDAGSTVLLAPMISSILSTLAVDAGADSVVLISPTSTSTMLSADNAVIRLLPDDRVQADVTVRAMQSDGITKLVKLFRDDIWGYLLGRDIDELFMASGGTVEHSVSYDSMIPEPFVESAVAEVAEAVSAALETTDASKIAVHISCFEEGVMFLREAAKYPDLAKVRWYSADGFAKNSELLADDEAAAFAAASGLSASQFGEPVSADFTAVQAEIAKISGTTPYSPAMLLYDCAWIAAKTAVAAGMDDTAAFKAKFIEIAESHEGLFGAAKMNENGDRINGDYDLWTLTGSEGSWSWEKSRTFSVGE